MQSSGLIHVYTGEGKGKTTASVGLAVRAAGQGRRVLFVQFFKEDSASSGEKNVLTKIENVEVVRSNCRHPFFTGSKTDREAVGAAIRKTFDAAVKKCVEADLLVLDEMMAVVNGDWIKTGELIAFLESKPPALEVVLTGRDAPPEVVRAADYVTEMLKIKHPFDTGVQARKGVEF